MKPPSLALIAFALLGLLGSPRLPAAPTIRIAVETNNAPLSSLDEKGRPVGFMVELVQEMSRVSGVEMEVVPGYWREHFTAFNAGKLTAFGNLADTPSNRADVNLSVGHARMHAVVYTPTGRPGLHRIADFAGKTIATIRGTASNAQALANNGWGAKIISYPNWNAAFAATKSGTCYATLFSNQLYRVTIDDRELSRNFVEDLVYAYHFGARKDDPQTLAIINEALAQLMRNGEFDRLYAKWIGPIEPRQIRFADLKPYLLPLCLGFLAIVAFILWQSHLLRRLRNQAAALRVSEQRWRFALDGSGVAVWDWNLRTNRVFFSPVWKHQLGYDDSEIGDTPEDAFRLIHPEDLPKTQATLEAQRLHSPHPFALEHRMRCKNGTWKWILSRGTVIDRAPDGIATRMIGIFSDLTPAKQNEENRLILGKIESSATLAAGIAHDFNNLLTTVALNVDLALWPGTPPTQSATYLADIKKSVASARLLTQQLTNIARGNAPTRRPTSLPELLRDAAQLVLGGSEHAVRFDFPDELAPADVDPDQIGQIVRNILVNAREAMSLPGTVTIGARNITIGAQAVRDLPAGNYVRLSFSDTGPGLDPAIATRIFDPYFSTKQRSVQKGMGLGLAVSLSAATRHHGTITVDASPGQGATFHVYLPVTPSAATPTPTAPLKLHPPSATHDLPPQHVLVMDDDPGVRSALAANLQKLGCRVEVAPSGQSAVAAYRLALSERDPFDIALLDLTVQGGMGGIACLQALRQLDSGARAILMSGYADNEMLREHQRHGFSGSIAKPFTAETLRVALQDALPPSRSAHPFPSQAKDYVS